MAEWDFWYHVFKKLDMESLFQCREVCIAWCSKASDSTLWNDHWMRVKTALCTLHKGLVQDTWSSLPLYTQCAQYTFRGSTKVGSTLRSNPHGFVKYYRELYCRNTKLVYATEDHNIFGLLENKSSFIPFPNGIRCFKSADGKKILVSADLKIK